MYQPSLSKTNSASENTTSGSIRTSHNEAVNSNNETPLSIFVKERLQELGLKQSDFCRLYSFDQGMLSRIQNSIVFKLNLESVLRLAIGLQVSPSIIFELIGRTDLHELVTSAYDNDLLKTFDLENQPGT
jgi:transcriptional regulator with XRE-family HTH domain